MGLVGFNYQSVKDACVDYDIDTEYRTMVLQIGKIITFDDEAFNKLKLNSNSNNEIETDEKIIENKVKSMFSAFAIKAEDVQDIKIPKNSKDTESPKELHKLKKLTKENLDFVEKHKQEPEQPVKPNQIPSTHQGRKAIVQGD